MSERSTIVCRHCGVAAVLPNDPVELADAMTAFVDSHNLLQHYNFDLIPDFESTRLRVIRSE